MEWMALIVPVAVVGLAFVLVSRGAKRTGRGNRDRSSGGDGFMYGSDASRHHGHHHEGDGMSKWDHDQPAADATPESGSDGGGFDSDGGGGFDGGDGGSD